MAIGTIAGAAVKFGPGVLKAIELAWKARSGWKAHAAESEQAAQQEREAKEYALRLMGSVLFEMRTNCEAILEIVSQYERSGRQSFSMLILDFSVSNALMEELCRVAPSPRMLSEYQSILAALKHVDFYQRAAGNATTSFVGAGDPVIRSDIEKHERAAVIAGDMLMKGLIERYNELVYLGGLVGNDVYGAYAWTMKDTVVPEPFRPADDEGARDSLTQAATVG